MFYSICLTVFGKFVSELNNLCFGEFNFSELAFGKFSRVYSFNLKWLIKEFLLKKYNAILIKNSCEYNFYLFL